MERIFREENIVVLNFPENVWFPTLFDIEKAEQSIKGLWVNVKQGIWSLDEKETKIGKTLLRYEGFFLGELVSVNDPTEMHFDFIASKLIQHRKELFLSAIT